MHPSEQRCAVTGATGYVGSRISDYLATRDWTVFELARKPSPWRDREHIPYQLDSPVDSAVFRNAGVRVLIHCAYDFWPVHWEDIRRVNVEGSARLFLAAKNAAVERIIFISSISAFDSCRSLYGKAKLQIEEIARDLGVVIVRPGLVYGDQPAGMFGSLQRSATTPGILPLIGSGKYLQYLIHEDDLSELLRRLSSGEIQSPRKPIIAAFPQGWQIRDLLQAMAAAQNARVHFAPLPWRVIWLALKLCEMSGIRPPFRSDSVISLVRQDPSPDFTIAAELGCRFREFNARFLSAPSAGLAQASRSST